MNILKTSNLLSNASEAIGSQILSGGDKTGSAQSLVGNHVQNQCWLIHRGSSLNYGSTTPCTFRHLVLALI